eukprot:6188463-Pleurochrysis_carterae.AAC.1
MHTRSSRVHAASVLFDQLCLCRCAADARWWRRHRWRCYARASGARSPTRPLSILLFRQPCVRVSARRLSAFVITVCKLAVRVFLHFGHCVYELFIRYCLGSLSCLARQGGTLSICAKLDNLERILPICRSHVVLLAAASHLRKVRSAPNFGREPAPHPTLRAPPSPGLCESVRVCCARRRSRARACRTCAQASLPLSARESGYLAALRASAGGDFGDSAA